MDKTMRTKLHNLWIEGLKSRNSALLLIPNEIDSR